MLIRVASLMRIGQKANDKFANAVCLTRTSAYTCLLSGNFSEDCKDISLEDGQNFFLSDSIFIM
jgi:hypothetical protein